MKAFPVRKISHPHHKTDISANAAGRFPQLFLKFFACTQGQKHTVIQTSAFPGTDTKLHLTPTAGDQDSSEQQSGICGTVRQKSAERTITICRKRQSRNSVKPRHYYLKSPTGRILPDLHREDPIGHERPAISKVKWSGFVKGSHFCSGMSLRVMNERCYWCGKLEISYLEDRSEIS